MSSTFKKHENIKLCGYGQRIREVECASFTPIVLSVTEGFAHEASVFYKHLACLFKWGDEYSGWLFCSLCFSLLLSAIQCIRGAHSFIGVFSRTPPAMDLVRVESSLSSLLGPLFFFSGPLFSCPAHAICAEKGGLSIKPGKKSSEVCGELLASYA